MRASLTSVSPARAGATSPRDTYVAAVTTRPAAASPSTNRSVSSPMARCLPSRTMSLISPNTRRSPATVPERLATSSAFPVTSPAAKRLAKCADEFASATALLTRLESSSFSGMSLSRASSTRLSARSASSAASAASIFSVTTAGSVRRAEVNRASANPAGSSCAARIRAASRARGHSSAQTTAHTTIPAKAIRFIPKNRCFRLPENGAPFFRHNVPDERRASLGRQDCVEFTRAECMIGALGIKGLGQYEYSCAASVLLRRAECVRLYCDAR